MQKSREFAQDSIAHNRMKSSAFQLNTCPVASVIRLGMAFGVTPRSSEIHNSDKIITHTHMPPFFTSVYLLCVIKRQNLSRLLMNSQFCH